MCKGLTGKFEATQREHRPEALSMMMTVSGGCEGDSIVDAVTMRHDSCAMLNGYVNIEVDSGDTRVTLQLTDEQAEKLIHCLQGVTDFNWRDRG